MRITIYRRPDDYISHNFLPKELDSVKKLCYINKIKFYVLNYSEEEYKEATKNIQIDKVEIEKT